ncbi:DUF4148 domain-containing protein [Paraburkholderia terrae]|uniref:DUF4148 domain-containing protein n=1 Tax=Paraburkholderia terrae TaxID=311230 RepID=A0A2I8F418_9BURK|nr:DUF4148 domain-containing protein [Paraburkholderia terrae]AUT66523.1 DUF4148 domain-containing protein [Paraburkholderia terrae]
MKAAAISNLLALAVVLTSIAVSAHTGGGGIRPQEQSTPQFVSVSSGVPDESSAQTDAARADGRPGTEVSPALGKTRAQVRAELVQAGEEGMLPPRWVDYPPSAATSARNRENFIRVEQVGKAKAIIPPTSANSTNGSNEEQQ